MGSLTERLSGAASHTQARQAPAKAATPASTPPASGPYQWAVIEPDLFPGEDVLFVIDPACLNEARAAHPGLVTYLTSEIDLLWPLRDNKDFIKRIHRVKKHLGGWLREIRPRLSTV
jgi:hypothetical protein